MKKNLLFTLTCAVVLFLNGLNSRAQTKKLIHYWHFNNTVPSSHLGAVPADYSTLGNASVIYKPIPGSGSDTTNVNDFMDNINPGGTLNQRSGYAGCCGGTNYGVRTRNPSDNMQFVWYIPTNHYQNIVIKYETQSSGTASGQHRQVFSYSIDSAKTFITAGLPMTYDSAGTSFGIVTLDFSALTSVNNSGKFAFRMTFAAPNTGNSGNNRFDNITVEGDTLFAPVFTSTALTSAIFGRLYSYTIKAVGSPTPAFSVTGNPVWLTLHDSILSGTPTLVDTVGPITITATNAAGSSDQVFSLMVSDSINPIAPVIKSTAPVKAKVDSLFSYTISTIGVPKPAISVTGNPAWLTLTDSTLSGIPTADGIYGPITITATNILGSNQQTFSITVPAAPVISSSAITTGLVDSIYTYSIATTGTPLPALAVSGIPSWLTLTANKLSGTPSVTGTFGPITVTATNTEGSNQQTFSIIVSSIPLITSTAITTGFAGSVYTYSVTATGTPTPVLSVNGNPSWLSLTGNTLSGTPTSSGLIGPITIIATNIASFTQQSFYLNIANPKVNTSTSKLIHYWHFNNSLPIDGSGGISFGSQPISADYTTVGNAALVYEPVDGAGSDTGYIDNYIGDTINQRPNVGGCCGYINNAVRTRNPSDSMEFLWYLPTAGYKNIVVRYETQLSSIKSGQHEQIFSYSIDSALTFKTIGLPVNSNFADSIWEPVTLDLRSILEANNNSKFVLKINFSAPNTGTKGNNRFDNITVEGDSISQGNGIHDLKGSSYFLYPNPAYEIINLIAPDIGSKTISIYNPTGVIVETFNLIGKELQISIRELKPGFYFMKIRENNGGNINIMKFIKE